jgi:hypothetical protein
LLEKDSKKKKYIYKKKTKQNYIYIYKKIKKLEMKNIKKILQFIVRNPIECKTFYLGLFLNIFFYIYIVYNALVIWYSCATTFIGLYGIFAVFSTVSSFGLVYGLPFAFKFEVSHILGQIYIFVLSLFTCMSTVYLLEAPCWVFLGVLLVGFFFFNIALSCSSYFESLSPLKSLPIVIHYKKLFFEVVLFGTMATVVGICCFTFYTLPIVVIFVCVYVYALSFLFIAFAYLLSFFRGEVKENKKKSRKLPTAITKLLILKRNNPSAFYDIRILYLALFTFLGAYPFLLYVFIGASLLLGFMHVFGYYVITLFIMVLVVSFPNSQKWFLSTYGTKSLRLLGW